MQIDDLEHFKSLLLARDHHLTRWLAESDGVGGELTEKVRVLIREIRSALERIESESYGRCTVCHGELDCFQLEIQPEATICIGCLGQRERALLEEDLSMAGKMHRALLPSGLPEIDGFAVAAKWMTATVVGGDYYDFLPCGKPDQLTRVIIADAMGHGVSAGFLISNLQGALRVLSHDVHSPVELVSRLNQWLCRNMLTTKFISLVSMCLERTGSEETLLTYANAGHCPPIIARRDGAIERLDATGTILGVHEKFTYGERKTLLQSGDSVWLYTDGITEATDPRGEEFGEDRLVNFIEAHHLEDIDTVAEKLQQESIRFSGSSGVRDDLTLIGLRKL